MQILMLNHEYPPIGGGAGVAMKHLAESLVCMGYSVLVVTVSNKKEDYQEAGVRVVRIPIRMESKKLAGLTSWISFLQQAPQYLTRAIREFKPDIINSHFLFPSGYVVAREGINIPHITSVVGADIHDPTRLISADRNLLIRWLMKGVVSHATVITTPSRDLTKRTKSLFPSARVETIPWGVPSLECQNQNRSVISLPPKAFVVSCVCRLVKRKRLDLLLEAVAQLNDHRLFVIIIGYGPEETSLKELAHKLAIADQVVFTGYVTEEDKTNYLKISDIFVLPSEHEGFGLVFIEAMSMGVPVITTNLGGQSDIIRNGKDGFLVPVGNSKAIVDRLRLLSNDPPLLKNMSLEANRRAQDFSPQISGKKFAEIYTKVLTYSNR